VHTSCHCGWVTKNALNAFSKILSSILAFSPRNAFERPFNGINGKLRQYWWSLDQHTAESWTNASSPVKSHGGPFNPLTAEWALRALIDFTLSNARRFYSSMGNALAVKGLTASTIKRWKSTRLFLGCWTDCSLEKKANVELMQR